MGLIFVDLDPAIPIRHMNPDSIFTDLNSRSKADHETVKINPLTISSYTVSPLLTFVYTILHVRLFIYVPESIQSMVWATCGSQLTLLSALETLCNGLGQDLPSLPSAVWFKCVKMETHSMMALVSVLKPVSQAHSVTASRHQESITTLLKDMGILVCV